MNGTPQKRPKARTTGIGAAGDSAKRRIAAFERQFHLLEAQVYKLEVENARLRVRIKMLEEANPAAAVRTMTNEELAAAIASEKRRASGNAPDHMRFVRCRSNFAVEPTLSRFARPVG
jgi:hypothetical protein